jgi:alkaline phosphatase D
MAISGDCDRRISRRTLLRTGGTLALGATLGGALAPRAKGGPPFVGDPFSLGIASGDPTPDGIVLWTRLAPDPTAADGGVPAETYGVRYEVARDEAFSRIIRRGAVEAVPDEAHSVHVELSGLDPATEYFYRFKWGPQTSPAGRTRTAPPAGSATPVDFAFVSCQNWPNGYFTAYADIAAQDPDVVVHLGDYIYEGGASGVRAHAPAATLMTLSDYGIRHAQYKTDADLQTAHALLPWIVTWDDHEVSNNYANLDSDPDSPVADLRARRAAAYQAYWEHMPLSRSRKPTGPDMNLYRRLRWGTLVTFNVLDGRQFRSDQADPCTTPNSDSGYCPAELDPSRTMLGGTQLKWLTDELATTTARWNVLANQVAFGPYDRDPNPDHRTFNNDSWDGYVADRQRIVDALVASKTPNPVVITGDSHANWVREVPADYRDFSSPTVTTDFMGTSVSTGGDPANPFTTYQDDPQNPQLLFHNNNRGWVHCKADANLWTSEYRKMSTVTSRPATGSTLATFALEDGNPGAHLV